VHLSEILGLPVFDPENRRLGRPADLRIVPLTGLVRHILVRRNSDTTPVPWNQVDPFSPENRKIDLRERAEMQPAVACEGETLGLRQIVPDRQSIGTRGRKVVRVNDVLLELSHGQVYVRRVEIGLAGTVRRLVAGILAPRRVRHLAGGLSERGIPWEYGGLVEPRSAQIRLKVRQQLARLHPADVADIIEDLGRMECFEKYHLRGLAVTDEFPARRVS
jgi:sporulation protein YlmC with PRC-barrel domain